VQQLRTSYQEELANTPLPADLCHRFDQADSGDAFVRKTVRRQVVTLELGRFTAAQVVRATGQEDQSASPLSALQTLVPAGGRYGYDLIAHVGWETFVKGRTLQDVAEGLRPSTIPFSSLHDVQQKFLFYLGHLHRQRAWRLRDYFRSRQVAWLIDCTVEPGAPAFFGIQDAEEGIMLGAWKVATENADVLVPCLKEASDRFGRPQKVLHDLSDAMDASCRQAWDDMKHEVCHFHLVRDIGEGLLDKPQAALRELVRQLQIQSRLKEQRNGQTDWLRQHAEDPTALAGLLDGNAATVTPAELGRQVLVAFHQWLLDYASDGGRQGYPFDPYLLYFHRRVVRASAAAGKLLGDARIVGRIPVVLKNFDRMLRDYLGNAAVIEAARQYEAGFKLLSRVRDALRLSATGASPLSDRYVLAKKDVAAVRPLLEQLRQECRQASQEKGTGWTCQQNQTVVDHLDRHWDRIFTSDKGDAGERTTNGIEQTWGASKRRCRKRHGRKKLAKDFQSLAAEFMLLGNLEQQRYVEVMLDGKLDQLAKHLADAGRTAGAWTKWRAQQQPLNTARLPKRLLRRENLIETFVSAYQGHCQGEEL
jgi:hypothetical protein